MLIGPQDFRLSGRTNFHYNALFSILLQTHCTATTPLSNSNKRATPLNV